MKETKDPGNIACVINMQNGMFNVYKCASKEEPQGFREILHRFGGFSNYGKALDFANKIEGKK